MLNGIFYTTLEINLKPLQELFHAAVLKMLKKEGKIDDDLVRMLIQWRPIVHE